MKSDSDTAPKPAPMPARMPAPMPDAVTSGPTGDHLVPAQRRALLAGLGGLAAGALLAGTRSAHAGPLDPPAGPVVGTGKTLSEVEPRTVINAANTPGDADSVFKITQPGSYYLTANVQGPAGKSGIEIAAGNVTVDLNGFSLLGEAGSASGIVATASINGVSVRNGCIRGWGSSGVNLINVTVMTLEDVIVTNCATAGINVGGCANVRRCLAAFNTGVGIAVGPEGVVESCEARQNTSDGITLSAVGSITRCVSRINTGNGIRVISNGFSTISDNVAADNDGDGIRVFRGCIVARNNCAFNNSTTSAGIRATGGDNRIEDNLCSSNRIGVSVDFSGNFVVRNTCSGNATNWSLSANNIFGPIVDRTAPGSAAVSGNAAASTLGTTDANANFTY